MNMGHESVCTKYIIFLKRFSREREREKVKENDIIIKGVFAPSNNFSLSID